MLPLYFAFRKAKINFIKSSDGLFPEFITTGIGLLIGFIILILAIVRKKPDSLKIKPVKHVVGEVIIQDIDCEEDDITL
jgi:hypothetical protein